MMPNTELLRRAESLAPRPTRAYVMAEHGPCERALFLRRRIGMALAILEAAQTQAGLDPRAAAYCADLHARLAHLPAAWEGAFGRAWDDGRRLSWHEQEGKRGPAARALRAQAYPEDNRRPLDEWPAWQQARAVCLAIGQDAEREKQREALRRRRVVAAHVRRARFEQALRARRQADRDARDAAWERLRQERELHEFRMGTQRRVRFPKERGQRVRSR